MPNSLIPDFPITTTEMPRSSLSKGDIAAPMRDMAEARDKTVNGYGIRSIVPSGPSYDFKVRLLRLS